MQRGVVVVGAGILLSAALGAFYVRSSTTRPAQTRTVTQSLTPEEERAHLESLAKAYWKARVEGDLNQAYTFEDPSRQEGLGKQRYRKKVDSGISWEKVKVAGVRILPGGELADVDLAVRYRAPLIGEIVTVSSRKTDNWQKLDGVWYHVLDTTPLPKGQRPVIPGTKPKGAA